MLVSESCCCWNKLPQASGYSFTVLKTGGQESHGANITVWAGLRPSGGRGENLFPDRSQLLEVPVLLGPWPLPSPSKPSVWHLFSSLTFASIVTSLPLTLTPPPCLPFIRTLVVTLGPPGSSRTVSHLRILNFITDAKSPFPCKVTCSQVPGTVGLLCDHGAHTCLQSGDVVPVEGDWGFLDEAPFKGTPQGPAR